MSRIDDVKILKGITDNAQDGLLVVIERQTEAHFKAYAGTERVPEALDYIIIDVMVKRFNRLDAEGMSSRSVEGLSMSFGTDDFAEYAEVIDRHIKKKSASRGVKFI